MSISDAINNVKQKISNVYNALEAKGATMPGTMNLDHMVTTVETIPEFWQTINLFNGWNATINEYGFVLTSAPDVASVTVPNVNGVYLNTDLYDNDSTKFYNVQTVDLQGVPFVNNNMWKSFYQCNTLTSVSGINENVTNMRDTFLGCENLNKSIQIPNSVTDMAGTFQSCSNFCQYIQIPSLVTNIAGTFMFCNSLAINILSENISNAYSAIHPSSSSRVSVIIPFKYTNNVATSTFNSFVNAGYLYPNGTSRNSQNTYVCDSSLYQYAYRYVGDGIYFYLDESIPSEGDYVYVRADSTGVNFYNSGYQAYNVGENSFCVNMGSTEYIVSSTPYSHLPDPIHIVTQ